MAKDVKSSGIDSTRLSKVLAGVLHEVLRHRVSVDVAFRRVCGGWCASSVDERELLYDAARRFVADYVKLLCVSGKRRRPRDLVKLWLSGFEEPSEPYCRLSVPLWLYDRLYALLGDEAVRLFEAMSVRVWWLRVNMLKSSIEGVVRGLESEGVIVEVSRDYPYMLKIIKTPKPVRLLRVVREFKAIPHDIASAVVVEALRPERGDSVLDACAAPGIKTSLIAMLAEGRVRIKAIDISGRRITVMRKLMRKLGVPDEAVEYIVADSRKVELREHYDKALVDAPCSNTGAMAKDPALRVTITPGKVEYYSRLQKGILENILKYASRVTYTTCSILPEEGEEVVETVADKVKLEKPQIKMCGEPYKGYSVSQSTCRLYPHIHESEGFYIANMVTH
ncbi:MAG: RsmB/NOP family class I SAM-dependent RNA methyltransferase [Acidilobaceae archaeon]